MKKIVILVCFFLTSCCRFPQEGFEYSISSDSGIPNQGAMLLYTGYELPQSRVRNFLSTTILIWKEKELKDDMYILFRYEGNGKKFGKMFFSDTEVEVTLNVDFSSSLTNQKDINFYTDVLSFDYPLSEVENKMKIYLRQDKGSEKIYYMIMNKPNKPNNTSDFVYLGHTVLDEISVQPQYIDPKPLPDILK